MSVDIISGRLFASEGGKKDEAQMPKRTRSAKLQLDAPSKLSKVISLRQAQFKHRGPLPSVRFDILGTTSLIQQTCAFDQLGTTKADDARGQDGSRSCQWRRWRKEA